MAAAVPTLHRAINMGIPDLVRTELGRTNSENVMKYKDPAYDNMTPLELANAQNELFEFEDEDRQEIVKMVDQRARLLLRRYVFDFRLESVRAIIPGMDLSMPMADNAMWRKTFYEWASENYEGWVSTRAYPTDYVRTEKEARENMDTILPILAGVSTKSVMKRAFARMEYTSSELQSALLATGGDQEAAARLIQKMTEN